MIPYDDLVAALASWRARQGLPTGQLVDAPAAKPAPAPAAAKQAPAPAPARRQSRPVSVPAEAIEVDEEAFEEASIDRELDSVFGGDEVGESTAIGTTPAPARPGTAPRRGGR